MAMFRKQINWNAVAKSFYDDSVEHLAASTQAVKEGQIDAAERHNTFGVIAGMLAVAISRGMEE